MKSILYLTFAVVLSSTIFIQCGKNQDRAFYPSIDEYVNITLPQYSALQVPGGWAYVNGGFKGILIYAKGGGEFIAYDRNCTYEEANSCGKITVSSDNILVDCTCDGSQYNIYDGSVNKSPASLSLKVYNTSFNSGNNTLRIYN